MNQNRNNNRRRGRSNRPGGGHQGNRIDSRARGNAPQMLEKYKKLAHDASLNGDRVQTEYYLQFADHYFRVIADNRTQKDDQPHQRARQNDRDQDDYEDESNAPDDHQQQPLQGGRHRDDRDDRDDRDEEGRRGSESESGGNDGGDNPFVRESKPRRSRPRKNGAEGEASGLDPAILPPSIGSEEDSGEEDERPRRRTRARRAPGEEEAREAHS